MKTQKNQKTQTDLCYKIPHWDVAQWEDYKILNSSEDVEAFEAEVVKYNELFPVFMNEIFHRLIRNDENCVTNFDTNESYSIKLEDWERKLEIWEKDKEMCGLADEDFIRIFGEKPEKPEKVNPKREAEWAHKLHKEISSNSEWLDLIDQIKYESFSKKWVLAGTGTYTFTSECLKYLPRPNKPLIDPEKLREEIREYRNELKNAIENGDEKKAQEIQEKIDKTTEEGKSQVLEHQNFSKKLNNYNIKELIGDALKKAASEVDSLSQALDFSESSGWGDSSGNATESGSIDEKIQIAKNLKKSKSFQKICDLLGRLKLLAEAKRKSKSKAPTTVVGVKTGNDLLRLLPTEYARFSHQATRKIFLKDYSESALLQYKLDAKQPEKKGPVIVLIDNSGSMAGNRETWSKAVALATLFITNKEHRDFYAVHFDEYVQATYEFPGNRRIDGKKITNFINFFSGGGTSWETPINFGLDLIEKSKTYKKADLILLTDDECGVNPRWLENFKNKQKKLEFTGYGVLIGKNKTPYSSLNFMDKVVFIPNLNDDSAIDVLF